MTDKPFSLSVKAVVLDDRGRCLLLKRSQLSKANAGCWDFPGGKLDPGESLQDALLREVEEETGLSVSLERVAGSAESETPEVRVAYIIMECRVRAREVRLSDEHEEHLWVSRAGLPSADLCPQFMEFARAYAATC